MTQEQLRRIEIGDNLSSGSHLFSRSVIKGSLVPVSKTRLEQTLYAEYPTLKKFVEALRKRKATQNLKSLSRIWNLGDSKTEQVVDSLVEVGFFERRGSGDAEFWIPFLYRDALELVQGRAEA